MTNRKMILLVATLTLGTSPIWPENASAEPPVPPRRILMLQDSKGQFVGLLVDPLFGIAARRVGDVVILLTVDESGFVPPIPPLIYETPDCSGQAFMVPFPKLTPTARVVADGTTSYPVPPYVERPMGSTELAAVSREYCLTLPGTFFPPDRCCRTAGSGERRIVGSVATIDLSNLVPPFHVEGL